MDFFVSSFKDSSFDHNIDHTNDMYGGFNPAVSNVYFTHGSLDPWHRMGVLHDLNKHSPSTVIPGTRKNNRIFLLRSFFILKFQLFVIILNLQVFRIVEIWAQ